MSGASAGEFELIARLAGRLRPAQRQGVVGIGDDCAGLPLPEGGYQLLTCDIAMAGRHFIPGHTPWRAVGWRVAVASVSDIAACGGLPEAALVSLGVPAELAAADLEGVYDGLAEAAEAYGFDVVGGNVSGADTLLVDVFMLGRTPRFVSRGGAKPGDRIAVSGHPGEAEAGRLLLAAEPATPATHPLARAHLHPVPRTDLVPLLRDVATACVDASDGVAADLGHVAAASGVHLALERERLPVSNDLRAFAAERGQDPLELLLHTGEGYHLLLTLPPEAEGRLAGTDLTVIGTVQEGSGLSLDGQPLRGTGWNHLHR